MSRKSAPCAVLKAVTSAALISVSYAVLATIDRTDLRAQTVEQKPAAQTGAAQLPPVRVDEPKRKPRRNAGKPSNRLGAAVAARQPQPPRTPESKWAPNSQDARTGTVGVYSNSTSVATKVNTPQINIPQSLSVVTKDFIKDAGFQNFTDFTRYVPGVAVHQGEGNRDELVIRGVDSSANFFVNGFRDDVQYFRDYYNTQSIEVLKGPSALTFGRGAGGGLVNRTLKEADGTRVYDMTAQTGSFGDGRVSLDAGQAVNDNVAARLNMFYEKSDTFRDYGQLERYGFNPTMTFNVDDSTKVKLSYEYFHDERTADRGNPSLNPVGGATRFNPAAPFAPGGDLTAFYGSPNYNVARANVNTFMAVIDHDFGNGLTAKNSMIVADYQKFYQNVYPGSAVDPVTNLFTRSAYQHWTNRQNIVDQTDVFYKLSTGPLLHSIAFGTELGRQAGIDVRNTGIFPNGSAISDPTSAFDSTYFGSITWVHQFPGAFSNGVTSADSNSAYRLYTQSAYARDTIDITRWLQLIGGARVDRFDISALDMNTSTNRERVDTKISPQAAVIVKPIDNLSLYGAYMVSYLPASGDQFSSLNNNTLILDPQKFENKEVGVKWNIAPRLLYTAAIYQLDRTGVAVTDPNNPTSQIPGGKYRIRGFETALDGYITNEWQSVLGYAYTDARVANDLSTTIVSGNVVQLVPLHQFSWWNKYQFTPMWGAALGAIYFSDSFATSDDTVKLPGFVRFDGAIYAKIDKNWKAQLNVENIFNKGYWASADGNNNISPGQSRTFRLSATASF